MRYAWLVVLLVIIDGIVVGSLILLTYYSSLTSSQSLTVATSAVAGATIASAFASLKLASTADAETTALIRPTFRIHRVYRLRGENDRVHVWVQNVGVGVAEHTILRVTWKGEELRFPEKEVWVVMASQTREHTFPIPEGVDAVTIRVDYKDSRGKEYYKERYVEPIKTRKTPPET